MGSFFIRYLREKMDITFTSKDPWDRYCQIIEVFNSSGFYFYVELKKRPDKKYWMLESDQYAGQVWEEQGSWERGTPPCPLWAVILFSLSEIGYTIILDSVIFNKEYKGYESTFFFEKITMQEENPIDIARKTIHASFISICSQCRKIRNKEGEWIEADTYFRDIYQAKFTHSLCHVCKEEYYSDLNHDGS